MGRRTQFSSSLKAGTVGQVEHEEEGGGDWLLDGGEWNDGGEWDDSASWEDS
jgi:hypothetical protein